MFDGIFLYKLKDEFNILKQEESLKLMNQVILILLLQLEAKESIII